MKEARKFLRKHRPTKVDVLKPNGETVIGYLLTTSVAMLGAKRDVLYPLSYVDEYHEGNIKAGHVVLGGGIFKIDDVIEHSLEPDRFLEVLTQIDDRIVEDWFIITIDGQEVHRTISSSKSSRARNQYLRERKRGKIKFNHMRIVDPAGNLTDFVFGCETPGMAAMREHALAKKLARKLRGGKIEEEEEAEWMPG